MNEDKMTQIEELKRRIAELAADQTPGPAEPSVSDGDFHSATLSQLKAVVQDAPSAAPVGGAVPASVRPTFRASILQSPAARSMALFVFVGLGFGVSTLAYLATTGMFDGDDIGSLLMGAMVLMASLVSVAITATFLSVLAGAYIGATHSGDGNVALRAGLATTGGHILLVLTFALVLMIGFGIFLADSEPTSSSENEESFAADPDESASEDDPVGMQTILHLSLPVIGSGLSGALTAWFYSWRPAQSELGTPVPSA